MVKTLLKNIGLALATIMLVQAIALAADPPAENPVAEASVKGRCASAEDLQFPPCATSPSECGSVDKGTSPDQLWRTPFNCLFLGEPIGGKPGYDLYKITPTGTEEKPQVKYELWSGEPIVGETVGPVQAVLAYEEGKESQGPFGLLYNYLGLVYNWLSGIIIGFVILVAIIGGIRMIISTGNQQEFTEGRKMILKALIGMAIWFTASVILYTINPTFFAF